MAKMKGGRAAAGSPFRVFVSEPARLRGAGGASRRRAAVADLKGG